MYLFRAFPLLGMPHKSSPNPYPRIGITASVNTYRPPNYDVKPKVGFTIGVGYTLALSELFSLQAELDYVQKSFESNYSNTTTVQYGEDLYALHETGSDQYAISYLELPILIKARILHDDFFVLGGFSVGMGLGGSLEYTYDATSSYLTRFIRKDLEKLSLAVNHPRIPKIPILKISGISDFMSASARLL